MPADECSEHPINPNKMEYKRCRMVDVYILIGIKHGISRTILRKGYVSEMLPAVKKCISRNISMMRLPHATRTTRKVNMFMVNIEVKYFLRPDIMVMAI